MARILVIEDNSDIQEILRTLLTEEHEVIQAFSGTEGIMRFDQGGRPHFARYHASWEKWGSGFKSHQGTKSNSSHYANGFER